MKRLYVVILLIAIVISLGAVGFFIKKNSRGKNYYDSKSASEMEKSLYNVSKDLKKNQKEAMDYDLTDIDEGELDKRAEVIAKNSNRDKQEVKEELKSSLERKKALYWAAKEAGCSVTDNEIEQTVQEAKKAIHSQKESEDEFKAVLSGMDVDEKEYWEMQKKQYEIDLLVDKYMEDQLKKKEEANKSVSSDDYEIRKKWQEEIEKEAMKKFAKNKKSTSGVK